LIADDADRWTTMMNSPRFTLIRVSTCLLWIVVLFLLIFGGPPKSVAQDQQLMQLLSFDWTGLSAWKVALFNLLGVWPMLMAVFLWPERQRVPYWPFGGLSFVLGMYALMPYFIFRTSQSARKEDAVNRWLNKKSTLLVLLLVSSALFIYGLVFGDAGVFWQELKSEHFVFAMSLDALLFQAFALLLLHQDRRRLCWQPGRSLALLFYALPLLGVIFYLLLRPAERQCKA
jgi:hypothetical protein